MTAAELNTRTVRDLASLAKKRKVPGWHSMKKKELVKALLRQGMSNGGRSSLNRPCGSGIKANSAGGSNSPAASSKASNRLAEIHTKLAEAKDLTFRNVAEDAGPVRDRLVVMVRDPYWLHAYWALSRKSVERAKVALGQHWHGAQPVLRLYEVLRDGVSAPTRQSLRDIEVRGGANNWYVDVPPAASKNYQLDIGYLASGGKFYCLARSNLVAMPSAADHNAFGKNLSDFEERPIDDSATVFGPGAGEFLAQASDFEFCVDADLILHGTTRPDARVTLRGEPVRLRDDGTFAVRLNLPDRRHVLPMVALSGDGAEQRTIVLAVDRNTKVMEPVSHDPAE
jgi:uncharacterized protein